MNRARVAVGANLSIVTGDKWLSTLDLSRGERSNVDPRFIEGRAKRGKHDEIRLRDRSTQVYRLPRVYGSVQSRTRYTYWRLPNVGQVHRKRRVPQLAPLFSRQPLQSLR